MKYTTREVTKMTFQSFAEALKVCLTSENGSPEQDEALVYCMEHAPDDLKEMLKAKFVQFHTGKHAHGQGEGCGCGCGGHRQKPSLSDFIK